MNNKKRVMVVLAIAIAILIGIVNLHCLYQSAKEKSAVQQGPGKGEAMNLTIHLGLVPSVHINIDFVHH